MGAGPWAVTRARGNRMVDPDIADSALVNSPTLVNALVASKPALRALGSHLQVCAERDKCESRDASWGGTRCRSVPSRHAQ